MRSQTSGPRVHPKVYQRTIEKCLPDELSCQHCCADNMYTCTQCGRGWDRDAVGLDAWRSGSRMGITKIQECATASGFQAGGLTGAGEDEPEVARRAQAESVRSALRNSAPTSSVVATPPRSGVQTPTSARTCSTADMTALAASW